MLGEHQGMLTSLPVPSLGRLLSLCSCHTPGGLIWRATSCFQGRGQAPGQEDARWKEEGLCQQPCTPEPGPAGKALSLQEVKTCPCVYFCWLPHCIITCQHVRCGFICALKTASSGRMQTLYSTLENVPPAQKQPLQIVHPFNKCI